jgi:hypothetical protein
MAGILLSARDLMAPPYGLPRRTAYAVLRRIGVRISPRRLVVHRDRLEEYLRGGEAV